MWLEALRTAGSEIADRDRGSEPADRREAVFLEALVGTGAGTEVWRARSALSGPLAIKRFVADTAPANGPHWLLEREAELLSRLAHPGLVATYGVLDGARIVESTGEPSRRPGLALEYLGGGNLVGVAGLHPRHWAAAAQRVLAAVAHFHAAGFAHGDIKVSNVLLDTEQRAKLVDLSSCMRIGSRCDGPLGTPSQQRVRTRGHTVSEDDDVFACAALVHELIAGGIPFADETVRAALRPAPLTPRHAESARMLAGLVPLVCGMLRSPQPLGGAELRALSAALASVERKIAQH